MEGADDEWTIKIEGNDGYGGVKTGKFRAGKTLEQLDAGEIGLSIEEGKRFMQALQTVVVNQEMETYGLARRVGQHCETFRPVKDYTTRRIRTVYGTIKVENPRWMSCRRCHPYLRAPFAPLNEICPDQATPELMELTARLGGMLPYRKAAGPLAEFLPINLAKAM